MKGQAQCQGGETNPPNSTFQAVFATHLPRQRYWFTVCLCRTNA